MAEKHYHCIYIYIYIFHNYSAVFAAHNKLNNNVVLSASSRVYNRDHYKI